jgi:hypothetical protein
LGEIRARSLVLDLKFLFVLDNSDVNAINVDKDNETEK